MSTILHIDVNSAFLSWSAVKLLRDNPESVDLRTIPSIVGGDRETRHGIVTAASIPAKKLGIRTADTVASALEKCPDLVNVSSDFHFYRECSSEFIEIQHGTYRFGIGTDLLMPLVVAIAMRYFIIFTKR